MFVSNLVVGRHVCCFVVMNMILDLSMILDVSMILDMSMNLVVVVFVVVVRPHSRRLGVVVVVVPGVSSP